jgi:hypothetical protein
MREYFAIRVSSTQIFGSQAQKTEQNRTGILPAQRVFIMKFCAGFRGESALTTADLLVSIIGLALLAMFGFPCTTLCKTRAMRIPCISNQKQIGLAFRMWANEHGDKFPMALPKKNGGARGAALIGDPLPIFRTISTQMTTPKVLFCPEDKERTRADEFLALNRKGISYLVGVDAIEKNPQMILTGDRNVTVNGQQANPGMMLIMNPDSAGWSRSIHKEQGNIGLADGSAAQVNTRALQKQLQSSGIATNRFAVP